MHKKVIIIAGEPSADMHGESLSRALKKLDPSIRITGIGGPLMRKAGVETFADLTPYAVIGFIEVLKHFLVFQKAFNLTLDKIKQTRPDAVILIDYPGFNLRLAKMIKKTTPKVRVIYYISPQVWAWGKKRIKLIEKVVDKMLVVFKFEETLYRNFGVDVEFIGHPLLEKIKTISNKKSLLDELGCQEADKLLCLLPGSRNQEVKRILPVMLRAADGLIKKIPKVKFLLIKSENISRDLINKILEQYPQLEMKIIDNRPYDFINICSFAWVCSGTATLETAILEIPMAVIYKISFFTWLISKLLIKLPYIGLVNVVAGKKIVPELIQFQANAQNLISVSIDFFSRNPQEKQNIKQELHKVREKLGSDSASKNSALKILKLIT